MIVELIQFQFKQVVLLNLTFVMVSIIHTNGTGKRVVHIYFDQRMMFHRPKNMVDFWEARYTMEAFYNRQFYKGPIMKLKFVNLILIGLKILMKQKVLSIQ